ncbi:MAG TPA: bifunctional nuclease family protein [Acidimicrobiales bacterium]|nr:bifunctional nuclease family protein [Acidimicrobiales bacterium]
MVEMQLADVRVSMPTQAPVVMLQEVGGARRILFIFIGNPEADAIVKAMRGSVPPRPLTHDLFRDVLEALGARLERVVVTELRIDDEGNGTFYAELHLSVGEARHVVSARPSDAIALAARTGSPIFANDALVDAEGKVPEDDVAEAEPDEQLVEKFHDFIEGIRPEDFAS